MFLVVTVLVSGTYGTCSWLLQYLFLVVTSFFILVVAVLVSGCSVWYGPRVSFCYAGTHF
jgi:hypothetical protein